ncbi:MULTISPECIES: acyl-CoA dehydrogenase family protein [Streptomyces]|uniref:acyl-CoA dehydrogenase family protein n=1 Tax=Streptomyces TaxID=1883 RepID=UPI0006F63968|nr:MULTISPECIES: acyl-CoA dehydrogenase family protein [Streptomyces]KQX80558.1 acyl-CoA dehydrogenase [Streptomyces sp. Root1319]KQZ19676.1 acyl-CoA dehydrogenase [Streptomyces sp. Root55]MDX3065464.1 acyl-CoA dehydrogenase family protein [Streptomyces sp. ND04-05B]WRY84848.1 acyl-CoA dehydrogenase family protein [Streptomyces clavifer]WUC30562.1 acyl-CoA dehydrogenase family protein [Streptomyces clavifer]
MGSADSLTAVRGSTPPRTLPDAYAVGSYTTSGSPGASRVRSVPPAPLVPSSDVLSRLSACAEAADRSGEPDREAVAVLRDSGLLALVVPRSHGGAGADAVALNTCVEQVAAVNASAAIMLFQHCAVTSRIVENGTPAQHREVLPKLAGGQWLAASAWSESGAGADKKNLSTVAHRTPDGGWLLDGAKSFTTSAGLADVYLVLAQSQEPPESQEPRAGSPASASSSQDTGYGAAGQTFFLIPGDHPGLLPDTSLRLTGMRGSATGFVSVRECRVPDSARLGATGVAASIIARVRDSGATLGAVAVGVAQAALDAAHAHAARRGLYAHQAVRHRLVDLATQVESARAVVERAGRRTAADPGLTTLHSKLAASAAAERVVADVAQFLGSAGYVETHPINRFGRDARAVALMGPTNDLCKELVSLPWNR